MQAVLIFVAVLGFLVCTTGHLSIVKLFRDRDYEQFPEGPLWTSIIALVTVGFSSAAVLASPVAQWCRSLIEWCCRLIA